VGVAFAAGPGDPDPTFGDDGKVMLPFELSPAHVLAQPDGKVVLTDEESFSVVRLNEDGSPDRGFSGDGVVIVDFAAGIRAAALQPDGKVVVAGALGAASIAVARFNGDGSLDRTFDPGGADGDGKKVYSGETRLGMNTPGAMIVEPDGRIVLAGPSTLGVTAARLGPDGRVEQADFEYANASRGDDVHAAALAPDGKIVVAGWSARGTDYDALVVRYNVNGSLDKSFAGTGRLDLGPAERHDEAMSALVQPDGKIVLGTQIGTTPKRMAAMRLQENGTPDAAFGDGGLAVADFPGEHYLAGAALQNDGKILLAGTPASHRGFIAARFDTTGANDPTFGLDGKTTVPFDDLAAAYTSTIQPDGRFVIAGVAANETRTALHGAVARVLTTAPPVTGDGQVEGPSDGPAPGSGSGVGSGDPTGVPPVPTCAGRRATLVGTARAETLRGTRRADVIVALGGRDRVLAGRGRDIVCGRGGGDRLVGGRGDDLLLGGTGHDRCIGGPGRDRVRACEPRRGA
jgi:uncharacterized delta-60 repeat protein